MSDLLSKGLEFLLHSVPRLIQLPLACQAGPVVFRDVFQQLANGHMRLQSFGNQIVQEITDLALPRYRSLGDALIRTFRQLQCHLYRLTRVDHRVLPCNEDLRIH